MSNKDNAIKTIRDVTFYYARLDQPSLQYEKKADPTEPLKNKEWKVEIMVSNDDFKKLKKAYAKAPNIKNAVDYEESEFEKYAGADVEWPFEEDSAVRLKFTQGSWNNALGRANTQPKVIGIVNKTHDKNEVEVNNSVSIGNGSKGHLQFRVYEAEKGPVLYLNAICVTELVEYVGGGSSVSYDDFGIEERDLPEDGQEDDDDPFA